MAALFFVQGPENDTALVGASLLAIAVYRLASM
jgi:hypothetical protein